VFEVLEVTDPILRLISNTVDAAAIERKRRAEGMVTMIEDGVAKCEPGLPPSRKSYEYGESLTMRYSVKSNGLERALVSGEIDAPIRGKSDRGSRDSDTCCWVHRWPPQLVSRFSRFFSFRRPISQRDVTVFLREARAGVACWPARSMKRCICLPAKEDRVLLL